MCEFLSSVDPKVMVWLFFAWALVIFVAAVLLVRLLWKWLVPELLPGAVSQGLVARELSLKTAFILTAGLYFLIFVLRSAPAYRHTYKTERVERTVYTDSPGK